MHPFQNRILPRLESPVGIEPTPDNLRDVSLCVAVECGWRFDALPNEARAHTRTEVFFPEGNSVIRSLELDRLARLFYRQGLIPHYTERLEVIQSAIVERAIIQKRDVSLSLTYLGHGKHVNLHGTIDITTSSERLTYYGYAPLKYPALAWSLAFLDWVTEGISHAAP